MLAHAEHARGSGGPRNSVPDTLDGAGHALRSRAIEWLGLVTRQDWSAHRADERSVERLPRGGAFALALAYANTYHVGMSSLGFQRVWELVHRRPGWTCERFFADGDGQPVSVETETPARRVRLHRFLGLVRGGLREPPRHAAPRGHPAASRATATPVTRWS